MELGGERNRATPNDAGHYCTCSRNDRNLSKNWHRRGRGAFVEELSRGHYKCAKRDRAHQRCSSGAGQNLCPDCLSVVTCCERSADYQFQTEALPKPRG